jgi:hypothetical protein
MTDRRAALVKRVSEVMALWLDCDPEPLEEAATAAIDLIRADVLEEAARELDRRGFKELADTAIRDLKGDSNDV